MAQIARPGIRAFERLHTVLDAWLRESDTHDQIVDFCIAIEALVGEGPNDLSTASP